MRAIILFVIAFSFSLPALAQDTASLMKAGDEAHDKFDNAQAVDNYKKAYEMAPDNFDAAFKLTRALVNKGEDLDSGESEALYVEAMDIAKTMTEKFPAKVESHYYLALASGKLAQFKGGKEKVKLSKGIRENAEKALEIDPGYFRGYLLLGVYFRNVANLSWFLKVFAKTFFGEPLEGTLEESAEYLEKAVELGPTSLRSHYELAVTYKEIGRKDESQELLNKALEMPKRDHLDDMYKEKARKLLKK